MAQIKQGGLPSTRMFDHIDFLVHLLDAPREWFTKKMVEMIASQVGKVIAV